jgi:acyl carrier protein
MSDVADRVKKILSDHLGVELEKVTDTAVVTDDLHADSLDMVELAMSFEEEFDIDLPDDEAENAKTVGEVIRLIEKVVAAKTDAPREPAVVNQTEGEH